MVRPLLPFGDEQGSQPRSWVYAVLVGGVMAAALVGAVPRWPGLAHEVALPPLDLFADLRVLIARAPSTPFFVIGVAAAVVARAALLAAVLGFTRRRFRVALRFYGSVLVPALLASGLDFSGRAILYAYLIWGGLAIVIITFLVMGAAPWTGRDTLHGAIGAAARQRFRFGALVLYLILLAVVGDVWRRPGALSQVLVVPLSGILTVVTARRLSAPAVRPSLRSAAIAVVVVALVVLFAAPRVRDKTGPAPAEPRTGSLLLVPGVDTSTGHGAMYRFNPRALGYTCAQTFYFSYRGPGPGGEQGVAQCPIVSGAPYHQSDTTRPLHELTADLRAELAPLPRPVLVVTHSQGAWIAWSEITTARDTTVGALVMLAPFDDGLAPYPSPSRTHTGAAGGVAVRLVTDLGRSMGISKFDPDAPLARELQGTSGAVERLVSHPLPLGVRGAAILARADLPLEPRPWPHRLPEACPGWLTHAALPTSSIVTTAINRFLQGKPFARCPHWIAAAGHASDAFGAPPPDA
jgi:hypothetical protein